MVSEKRVTLMFKVECGIHSTEIGVRYFEGPMPDVPPLVYRLDTVMCPVNDGCEPEHYLLTIVGDPKIKDSNDSHWV